MKIKDNSSLERKGRYMSKLLRHSPEDENLVLDDYGYCDVKSLCKALKLTIEELEWIVNNNNKKRFEFNEKKTKIKASQGHSFEVKLNLESIKPPLILYHGTTFKNKSSITKNGLLKMNRQHVHLTDDKQTAFAVGMRYAKDKFRVWIISINAKQMHKDGYTFYKTQNGVYLTDHVPSKYII